MAPSRSLDPSRRRHRLEVVLLFRLAGRQPDPRLPTIPMPGGWEARYGWSMAAACTMCGIQGRSGPLPEHLHWFKWEAYTTWLSGHRDDHPGLLVGRRCPICCRTAVRWRRRRVSPSGMPPWPEAGPLYDLLCRSPLARHEGAWASASLVLMGLPAACRWCSAAGRCSSMSAPPSAPSWRPTSSGDHSRPAASPRC